MQQRATPMDSACTRCVGSGILIGPTDSDTLQPCAHSDGSLVVQAFWLLGSFYAHGCWFAALCYGHGCWAISSLAWAGPACTVRHHSPAGRDCMGPARSSPGGLALGLGQTHLPPQLVCFFVCWWWCDLWTYISQNVKLNTRTIRYDRETTCIIESSRLWCGTGTPTSINQLQ
jgi:hypothetical protein